MLILLAPQFYDKINLDRQNQVKRMIRSEFNYEQGQTKLKNGFYNQKRTFQICENSTACSTGPVLLRSIRVYKTNILTNQFRSISSPQK